MRARRAAAGRERGRGREPGGPRARRFKFTFRLSVVAALALAAVVLATSMPVQALLAQHHQLDSTTAALARARAASRSLSAQVQALSDPAAVNDLARADYGLVPPGQKAYVVLAPAGSSSAAAGSGHVPLDGPPVVPGSALSSELLGLGTLSSGTGESPSASSSAAADHRTSARRAVTDPVGFWARVAKTLEFWR
jgi:cell division protein FtsB